MGKVNSFHFMIMNTEFAEPPSLPYILFPPCAATLGHDQLMQERHDSCVVDVDAKIMT